jgi:hypothetical protein
MAKTAKPKTKISIAADAARKAYNDAKDRDTKTSTAQTKAALDHAKTTKATAEKAEARERFLNIGGGRVGKSIAVIETLRQIANRRSYEYSATDIDKAFAGIDAKVAEIKAVFTAAMQSPVAAEKKPAPKVFKFE